MIQRFVISAVLCLVAAPALAGDPAMASAHLETNAEIIAHAETHCAEPRRSNCIAHELLTKVHTESARAKAFVSLASIEVEYTHKPRSIVAKASADMSARVQRQEPLIDRVMALDLPANSLQAIRSYWTQVLGCASKAYASPSEEMDAFSTRLEACQVPVQQQLDRVFVDLGYEAQEKHFGFRKSAWGDTPESVIAIEGEPSSKLNNGDRLVYQTTLSGHEAMVFFDFFDRKLAVGSYVMSDKHTDANQFIDDYDALAQALRIKYGAPSSHEITWKSNLFKKDREHWGVAVGAGQMHMIEAWHLADVSIMHLLEGDNAKINHILWYKSVEMQPLIDETEAAKAQEGL